MEVITAPLADITSKVNDLQAFFILLLIVVLAAIGAFAFVVIRMVLGTKERAETRNSQIEGTVHAVEELKVIVQTHIENYYRQIEEFKTSLKDNVQDLKNTDKEIFKKIDEASNKFIDFLSNRHK